MDNRQRTDEIIASVKELTLSQDIFAAAIALTDAATAAGLIINLTMPTKRQTERFQTKPFMVVSSYDSTISDKTTMHPTPDTTGAVHVG